MSTRFGPMRWLQSEMTRVLRGRGLLPRQIRQQRDIISHGLGVWRRRGAAGNSGL